MKWVVHTKAGNSFPFLSIEDRGEFFIVQNSKYKTTIFLDNIDFVAYEVISYTQEIQKKYSQDNYSNPVT